MHEHTRLVVKSHAIALGAGLVIGGMAALLIALRISRTEVNAR